MADVVAEEAAKRFLPDMNLEREAKKAERIGVNVAKCLAFVQADIWASRGEAGDICELDLLLREEDACTRSAFGRLVDELAHQGRLLVRHKKRIEMQSLQRVPCRQTVQFLEPNTLCPSAMCGCRHLPFQKQEKTAHQRVQ